MITGPPLSLSALYATSISNNCVYEGIPLTADIVGEGIGTHYPSTHLDSAPSANG